MSVLQLILDQAGPDFYRIDRRWQPKDLLPVVHSKRLLNDVQRRLELLEDGVPEFKTLQRAAKYDTIIKRMQIDYRRAKFAWRQDDLVFIQAVAEFYQDYGTILQMLKIDEARGVLKTDQGD